MATRTSDVERDFLVGLKANAIPAIAADQIFKGSAVGDNGAGYGRPLVAGDIFKGFAADQCDNLLGAAGAKNIDLRKKGVVQLSVSGAVITDVDQLVFASDDDTFVFTPTGNTVIGKVVRFVSSGIVMVSFDADNPELDVFANKVQETHAANYTVDLQDCGKVLNVNTDAVVITLPATDVGIDVVVRNIAALGVSGVSISPNANDKIQGPDTAGTDNKDQINTKATAQRGDFLHLLADGAEGWFIKRKKGTWAEEA
jgi:hypothetical protein